MINYMLSSQLNYFWGGGEIYSLVSPSKSIGRTRPQKSTPISMRQSNQAERFKMRGKLGVEGVGM